MRKEIRVLNKKNDYYATTWEMTQKVRAFLKIAEKVRALAASFPASIARTL